MSFFITKTWLSLLEHYPGALKFQIVMLLRHDLSLKYKRPETYILSLNLPSALIDFRKIVGKLSNNLVAWRISQISLYSPFVYGLLSLVPKSNSRFCKIHHFSPLPGSSVNDRILEKLYTFVSH